MELSPDKTRLLDTKERIKDVKLNQSNWLQSQLLRKI